MKHSCCAPCSSYPLELLSSVFKITVFYYNPNITDLEEYTFRLEEQIRLIQEMNQSLAPIYPIDYMIGDYDPDKYLAAVKGKELEKEGGSRCEVCFQQRLEKTAELARSNSFDYFTTTLTISPLKNAVLLNELDRKSVV